MKYALIEGNKVSNVIEWDGNTETWQPPEGAQVVPLPEDLEGVGPGIAYTDGQFVVPVPQESGPTVPTVVTMRQARLALLAAGKLADVQDAITALPSPAREQAQIDWDYATEVNRDSATVAMMAQALALDGAALDALFTQAAAI